jgi:putative ABC transport system permease protein
MKESENLLIGLKELRSNKMRTSLTMLGIIFGVGAVIAMLSIGEGARQETLEQIELMGTNNILIKEKKNIVKGNKSNANFSPGLNLKDALSIKNINPFVEAVVPQRESINKVIYKSNIVESKIIGTSPDFLSIYNFQISQGQFFTKYHMDSYANVCVIGPRVKEIFFKFENPVGKEIKIEDMWFKVVGVTKEKNVLATSMESLGLRNFNEDIYIPLTTMIFKMKKYIPPSSGSINMSNMSLSFFNGDVAQNFDRTSVNQITVKIKKNSSVVNASTLVKKIFERRHYGVPDYEVVIPEQLLAQKQKTQIVFNIVMGAIAGISLLVGGIGIMNIMLANILERTKEIGIRRAIGATKRDVLNQFIYEAVTISILGGVLGIITGFILTSLITGYAEWRTIITPSSVILAFFVSVAVGLVFGIYPAKKAAEKDPIESLRYE